MVRHDFAHATVDRSVVRMVRHAILVKCNDYIDFVLRAFSQFRCQILVDLLCNQVRSPFGIHPILQIWVINYSWCICELQKSAALLELLLPFPAQSISIAV